MTNPLGQITSPASLSSRLPVMIWSLEDGSGRVNYSTRYKVQVQLELGRHLLRPRPTSASVLVVLVVLEAQYMHGAIYLVNYQFYYYYAVCSQTE